MIKGSLADYRVMRCVGEGLYAKVFVARAIAKKRVKSKGVAERLVAIKQLKDNKDPFVEREIAVLKRLQCANVIAFEEAFRHRGRINVVFEYAQTDVLKALGNWKTGFPTAVVQQYSRQLFSGLEFCHRQGVLHRDIKPDNLLLCFGGDQKVDTKSEDTLSMLSLKICDFGCARVAKKVDGPLTAYIATRWYRAPELLRPLADQKLDHKDPEATRVYGAPADVWAAGCVVAEMAIGKALFPGSSDADQLAMVLKGGVKRTHKGGQIPKSVGTRLQGKLDDVGTDLIEKLLDLSQPHRLTASNALFHPYLCKKQKVQVRTGVLGRRRMSSSGELETPKSIATDIDDDSIAPQNTPGSTASDLANDFASPNEYASPNEFASPNDDAYRSDFFESRFNFDDEEIQEDFEMNLSAQEVADDSQL